MRRRTSSSLGSRSVSDMDNPFIPPEGITEENVDRVVATIERATATLERHHKQMTAVGGLAMAWAGLDATVDELFEPLLGCSEAQVACIRVENIGTRCDMLKKLLHVEPLAPSFTDWVTALLQRASGELAALRNRYIHDAWTVNHKAAVRTEHRAALLKPQSRQRRKLAYKTTHVTAPEEIKRVSECVGTVSMALKAAAQLLKRWRSGGPRPRVPRQWLPASKPTARCTDFLFDPAAFYRPLRPLRFELD